MSARRALLYFSWSRPAETSAPLAVIEDRFPAIFQLRRLFYPKFEALTGHRVRQIERITDDGAMTPLDRALDGVDSVVVISFDSLRTEQAATMKVSGASHAHC